MRSFSILATAAATVVLLVAGCQTTRPARMAGETPASGTGFSQELAETTRPLRKSWNALRSQKAEAAAVEEFSWSSAIPQNATRADIVSPLVSQQVAANYLPRRRSGIRLVSAAEPLEPATMSGSLEITSLNGLPVTHYEELLRMTDSLADDGQVSIGVSDSQASGPSGELEIDRDSLHSLVFHCAPEVQVMRIAEDGLPTALFRENGIECRIKARVESHSGCLQLIVRCKKLFGDTSVLPAEVLASCDGVPLRCLSVADALELLYGNPADDLPVEPTGVSFANVSEQETFLLPTNFDELETQESGRSEMNQATRVAPAFASLNGVSYPGPPLLGDARALTAFMMQRQIFRANEAARTGWVLFAGDPLKRGQRVQVTIDLGTGPRNLEFEIIH